MVLRVGSYPLALASLEQTLRVRHQRRIGWCLTEQRAKKPAAGLLLQPFGFAELSPIRFAVWVRAAPALPSSNRNSIRSYLLLARSKVSQSALRIVIVIEMRRMRSRLASQNTQARRRPSLQLLERKDLLAGDSTVMVDFAVVSTATLPDDTGRDAMAMLPPSMERTHEWDKFAVEIWVHGEGDAPVDVQDLRLDLGYRTDLTSATSIQFGRSFEGAGSYTIDDASGSVDQIHGATAGLTLGANERVLFARVFFQAVPQNGDNVLLDRETGSVGPYSLELNTSNLAATNADANVAVSHSPMPEMGLYPVIYDLNDDQRIGMADFADFAKVFGQSVDSPSDGDAWFADFNKSSAVGLVDFSFFVQNFGKDYTDEHIQFPDNYPDAWTLPEDNGNGGGGGVVVGGGDDPNDPGNGTGQDPLPPVFLLDQFQAGIVLPGTMDIFQVVFAGVNWETAVQINRLTGSASISEGANPEDDAEVLLTIVLEDEELYETEIELIFDGELIDTLQEFDQFSGYITAYVSEVMTAVQGMLEDALVSGE